MKTRWLWFIGLAGLVVVIERIDVIAAAVVFLTAASLWPLIGRGRRPDHAVDASAASLGSAPPCCGMHATIYAADDEAVEDEPPPAVSRGATVIPINRLKDFLDEERVVYESIGHMPTYTTQRTAEAAHISGRLMAKTVLVTFDGQPAMIVVPAAERINLDRLRRELGAQRVELAREEEFEALFPDSEPGAEPPFGNLYGVPVFVSAMLARNAQIAFNAGTHTEVVRMSYADFERLVKPTIVRCSTRESFA